MCRFVFLEFLYPVIDLPARFVPGNAITFLDQPNELFSSTGCPLKFVIGQLAPLLPGLTRELLPVSFDSVPIHMFTGTSGLGCCNRRASGLFCRVQQSLRVG